MSERDLTSEDGIHDPRRPGRGPVLASVALHVVMMIGAWWAHRSMSDPFEYVSYQIELVMTGDLEFPEEVGAPEPPVVTTPEPQPPPPPVEETPPPPPPEPEPDPEPAPPAPEPAPEPEPEPPPPQPDPAPQPEPQPQLEQPPVSTETASSAEMNIRMEGLQRDFPAYYQQIVTEIQRCFRWDGPATWTAVLRFEIQSDGRVPAASMSFFNSSGNRAFDLAAMGAVECAGGGRFSPLPEDLPFDILPIQFTFGPARGQGAGG